MGGNSSSSQGMSSSPPSRTYTQAEGTRARIANVANSHVGSEAWARDNRKDNYPAGKYKCNKHVHDVLKEADASAPTKSAPGQGTWPLQAGDWAKKTSIDGWERLPPGTTREPGDVVAIERTTENATGHVAIVVSETEVVGAGTERVSRGDHGFGEDATVWRYVGKDDPDKP